MFGHNAYLSCKKYNFWKTQKIFVILINGSGTPRACTPYLRRRAASGVLTQPRCLSAVLVYQGKTVLSYKYFYKTLFLRLGLGTIYLIDINYFY